MVDILRRTKDKLEDCQILLDQLRGAINGASFRSLFNSFLSSARAVTYALQKDCKHIEGFNDWYQTKREEMRNDELMRFIHEARTEDFHEGKHRLNFSMEIDYYAYEDAGPPPAPDARLEISGDGPYWVVDEGTPRRRRISPVGKGGKYRISVWLENPPTAHKGKILVNNDPITICICAHEYLSALVHDASVKFEIS